MSIWPISVGTATPNSPTFATPVRDSFTSPQHHSCNCSLSIATNMNRLLRIPLSAYLLLSCALGAAAHGGGEHQQIVVADDADWATRHMAGKSAKFPFYAKLRTS